MDVVPQNVHWLIPEEPVPCEVFLHFRGKFALGLPAKQKISFQVLEKLAKAGYAHVHIKRKDLPAWQAWQELRHPAAGTCSAETDSQSKLYGNKRAEYLSYVQKICHLRQEKEKSLSLSADSAFALIKKVINHPMLDWYFQQFHEPPDLFFHGARVAYPLAMFSLLLGLASEKEIENIAFSAIIHELSGDPATSFNTVVSQQTLVELESEGKPVPSEVIELIRSHDELHSGKGYPKNLKADQIPKMVRAFTLFNHFDHYRLGAAGTRRARFDQAKQKMSARQKDYDPELWESFWNFWGKLRGGGLLSELRPDFFDLSMALPKALLSGLAGTPHLLQDQFGNTLSNFAAEKLTGKPEPLLLHGQTVATLQLGASDSRSVFNLLQAAMALELESFLGRLQSENEALLNKDLTTLLRLSENDTLKFEDLLRHFLKILQAHVWVERASIYGIYDGFSLEGLAGVGGDSEKHEWKLDFSSLAGYAATSRKPYHTENPQGDPNFQKKDGMQPPRNLLCLPLLHGNTLVGVMNLSNRVGGEFTPGDIEKAQNFANVVSHILQKHYFKKKMQTFERTSDHLGKYLSSKVVKNVKSKDQLELGGIEKKVVCLFSDIRGYTSITEGISAPSLVNLLNFHFERMHAIIEKYEGTLDKIVGDLIMAVWNIPNDQPDPELNAMRAAIDMQKEMLRVVVPEWKKLGVGKVGMGIGVNAGSAVVGNLGSKHFMNYTVIGDTINTAQRLEAKAGSGEIWMAEDLFPFVNGILEKPVRKECAIRLKGKEDTIDAYVFRPLSY